jgi:hypothetical protein
MGIFPARVKRANGDGERKDAKRSGSRREIRG